MHFANIYIIQCAVTAIWKVYAVYVVAFWIIKNAYARGFSDSRSGVVLLGKHKLQQALSHSILGLASGAQSVHSDTRAPLPSTRSWQTDGGTVPVNLFSWRINSVKEFNCPGSMAGTVPVNWLPLRYKSLKTGELPQLAGMVESNWLFWA